MKRRGLVAFAFAFTLLAGTAYADVVPVPEPAPTDDASGRSTEFRAMTGPSTESVPGGTLLVAAYGVVWLLLFGYALRLGAMSRETRERLAALEKALEKADRERMTPTIDHLLFIPATLLAGGALGFILGVKLTRRELERQASARRK